MRQLNRFNNDLLKFCLQNIKSVSGEVYIVKLLDIYSRVTNIPWKQIDFWFWNTHTITMPYWLTF